MKNSTFTLNGCHYCEELAKGILLANNNLPIDKKIDFIDVHSGDSRIAFMDNKFPNGEFPMPVTVLDSTMNIKGKIKHGRTVIQSSSLKDFDYKLLQLLA